MRPRLSRRVLVGLAAVAVVIAGAVVGILTVPSAQASNNGLSITPAMGWSSWSFVRRTPTEAKIIAQADAMKNSGLTAHGFVYANLDDFWMKCDSNGPVVDGNGRWVVDSAKFPNGMKFLANHIADTSKTEKNYNCKHMYYIDYSKPGAQEYVNSFANLFASWGADYLKIDGVGSFDIPDVQAWDKALRQTGRPINYALSNNLNIADGNTWKQLANSWRTQGDVECYCGPGPNGSGFPLTDWSHVAARFRDR